MKEVVYVSGVEKDMRKQFPPDILDEVLVEIERLKYGLETIRKTKAMNGLGQGVIEWIRNTKPAYRLVYVVGRNGIYVLHAFSKTSNGTPKSEEDTIKLRYKRIQSEL